MYAPYWLNNKLQDSKFNMSQTNAQQMKLLFILILILV